MDLCECAEEAPCRSLAKCRMCSLYPLLENIRDLIPKSACFEILGEGHSASRLCALACSMVPIVRGEQSRPVSTRPRRPCPLLLRFKVQFQSDNGMRWRNGHAVHCPNHKIVHLPSRLLTSLPKLLQKNRPPFSSSKNISSWRSPRLIPWEIAPAYSNLNGLAMEKAPPKF